jgi:serine/threonine-protein kinase SRPK3
MTFRPRPLTMVDRHQYSIGLPAEDLALYGPGGYHPVHLNDRFKEGRYEIRQKLGFGSFSTVWLARDHEFVVVLPFARFR